MNNYKTIRNLISLLVITFLVVGCANKTLTKGKKTNHGRYKVSKDYGPDSIVDVSHVKDAVPKVEPLSRGGNRSSYQVLGKTYQVLKSSAGYKERGGASWYGKKFHGYLTANGERYDMYGMSAAHKSLPIPTYVKVTNMANDRQVIVRVNDRGPFHKGRVIDLSYAAAAKLGMLDSGTAQVEIEAIDPLIWRHGQNKVAVQSNYPDKAPDKSGTFLTTSAKKAMLVGNLDKIGQSVPASKEGGQQVVDKKIAARAKPKSARARIDSYQGIHYMQVGVYSTEGAAHAVTQKVNSFELPVLISEIVQQNRELFRVILGPMKSRMKTEQLKIKLAKLGFPGAHLMDLPR
ncbi:MAG: rare lipoprotein A [Osedax symbiont Rs1]|nr:MAG: rare lipoprotein A [Osedax symbiont Rs1]